MAFTSPSLPHPDPIRIGAGMTDQPTILILAGKRDSKLDPLAARAHVSHKCRVPIAGKPLLQWVVEAVSPAFPDARVLISVHDPAVIADLPGVVALEQSGRLLLCEAQAGIVESVEAAIAAAGGDAAFPLLITTADNVLAEPEYLRTQHVAALQSGGDAVVVLSTREAIRAAHPEGQRRFYEFRDMAISNCNVFWLKSRAALSATEAFREGGQFAKNPARIARAFGLWNLIRFRFGWWTLDGAFTAMSRRFGVRIVPQITDDGAFAIDVDNERTYAIAEMLLKTRKSGQ
jgi:GTP:adenosylcobinamide-phosphate guanylyltransferase